MWDQTVTKNTIRIGGMGLFLGMVFLLVYRYCEQVGTDAQKSCIFAMACSFLAGGLSLWPFFHMLKEDRETLLLGAIWAISIRILISFFLIAMVLLFIEVHPKWFLGCYGIFYVLFMILDSWLILLLAGDAALKKKEVQYDYL